MKRYAPSGDVIKQVPLSDWPGMLADVSVDVQFHHKWYGYSVRTDQWSCRDTSRPWHTLYLVWDGMITGQVDDQPYRLTPQTFFWLNQHQPHDMTWPSRLVFSEVWFRIRHQGQDVVMPDPVVIMNDAGEIWPIMRLIEDELSMQWPYGPQKLRHLLAMLIIEVLRLQQQQDDTQSRLKPDQCRRLRQYLLQRVAQRPSLEQLANVVELSPDYFSRIFGRTFGCSPRLWMIRQRITEASRLLATTNLTVYQVADQLGYENVSQFSRQFKQQTGHSPIQYRHRHSV